MASDVEIIAMVEKVLAHLKTPEGQRELREANARTEAFAKHLREMTKVSHEKMHEPFTI